MINCEFFDFWYELKQIGTIMTPNSQTCFSKAFSAFKYHFEMKNTVKMAARIGASSLLM